MKRLRLQSQSLAATTFVATSLFTSQCSAFCLKEQQNAYPSCRNRAQQQLSLSVPGGVVTSASQIFVGSSLNRISWGSFRRSEKIGRLRLNTRMHGTGTGTDMTGVFDEVDYLVTDSSHVPDDDRPSLLENIQNPRDALALLLLIPLGGSVSICNILGIYTDRYDSLVEASAWIGILSGLAAFLQIATGYKITNHSRRFLVNDAAINLYAGLYALAVSWLALRAGNHCPLWLAGDNNSLAVTLPWVCLAIFLGSAIVPTITLWNPGNILDGTPELTETELLRARGILAIGILASIFAPDCLAFGLGGSDWWDRVSLLHGSQRTLESSTSLFALYANEASMISHRCGREGVAPYTKIVPAFAVVCLLLAIFPCIAALYYLGEDVSFFSFYRA